MTPFRHRLVNGSRGGPDTRFIRRLTYEGKPRPVTRTLPRALLAPSRYDTLKDHILLRWMTARSFRRRLIASRRRPLAWDGTRATR